MAVNQGFGSVFSAEMKRVVFRPKCLISTAIFAIASILLFVGMSAVISWGAKEMASQGAEGAAELAAAPAFLGFATPLALVSFCFGIYASAFAARDYNDGTIMATLLVVPNRGRLFMARMLPWVMLTAVFSLISFGVVAAIGIGQAGTGEMTNIILQGLLATLASVFTAIVGFCCGTITKKGSLSVFLFLGLFFIVPTVLGMAGGFGPDILQTIVKGINYALPGNAFAGLLGIVPLSEATPDTWISLGVSIAWIIAAPVLSCALFKSRGTLGK